MPLQRIIYRSQSTSRESLSRDLSDILEVSRQQNLRYGITGALTLCDGTYVQVLEGPAERVGHLLQAIKNDCRHTDLQVIGQWAVSSRLFSGWSMSYGSTLGASDSVRKRVRTGDHGLMLVANLIELTAPIPIWLPW